ncbi:MAG: OmpH family outer membrane protein, partial [Bacteroidales bacterium]|nr:OmpH family outer membrane protein [Bacteroidales bacterium]
KTNTLNNEILALIQDFVNRFNAGGRYTMIFANQLAGGVENYMMYLPLVSAPGAVDITDKIIEGMNAEYAARKAAQN